MIVESVGRLYGWVKDKQVIEVQRKMLDPKTHKTWYEYQVLIYTSQAKMVEQSKVGNKVDVTV